MKNTCKSFALDLMHLSTNELKEIKDLAGLKKHLAGCRRCQAKLAQLREVDTFTFLTRPRSAKYQAKMKALLDRVKSESRPITALVANATKNEIEQAAEKIHQFLKQTGKVSIPVIRKKTGLVDYPFYEAMGWLACREKVILHRDKTAYHAEPC